MGAATILYPVENRQNFALTCDRTLVPRSYSLPSGHYTAWLTPTWEINCNVILTKIKLGRSVIIRTAFHEVSLAFSKTSSTRLRLVCRVVDRISGSSSVPQTTEKLLTYLRSYLLTYSTEQSFSWEANRFSDSQEIPCILWNSKVHYRIHKCPPPVLNLS